MKFFSGFCFNDEQELFKEWLEEGDFVVSGFSYGAIKAFEYALKRRVRVDKLQLFSPAFFQDKDEKFKRLQTISFRKDSESYIKKFLAKTLNPSNISIEKYYKQGTAKELEELLNYIWKEEKIKSLNDKGTTIEVYLGEIDKIINPAKALDFFKPFADIYYIKMRGHILR